MLPVLSLVGRPNVGKSTLFNRLTRSRDALVADLPGLTRDRLYGEGRLGEFFYTVVDTGGLAEELSDNTLVAGGGQGSAQVAGAQGQPRARGEHDDDISEEMFRQTLLAIRESDIVLFLVDGRSGVTAADEQLAIQLRKAEVPVVLVVNKIDGVGEDQALADFYALAFDQPLAISASHGRGLSQLLDTVQNQLTEQRVPITLRHNADGDVVDAPSRGREPLLDGPIEIAFIGRPNVGKSTLINRLCGEERVIAFDKPGTTRDAISIPFNRNGQDYVLIDTAGIRRRGKVREVVEKFSVVKTLDAIERAHVCVYLLDALDGATEQDLQLLGYIIDKGRALVVGINKWDAVDTDARERLRSELERRVTFLHFTRVHFISALAGSGVNDMLRSVNRAFRSACVDLSTPELTRLLNIAIEKHQPPMVNGRRIKLRYAHQGGVNPPIIVIHGNQTSKLPGDYMRYLVNFFQKEMRLFGTPLKLRLKQSDNPYKDKARASRAGRGKAQSGTGRAGTGSKGKGLNKSKGRSRRDQD